MPVTYDKIATTTLGSATSTVTFSSISGSYTDLVVIFDGNLSAAGTCSLRNNNDSGNNYSQINMVGTGSSVVVQKTGNHNSHRIYDVFASSNARNTQIFNINNYSNTTTYKTTLLRGSDSSGEVGATISLWRSTAAINRLDFVNGAGTWSAGSTFTIYGILKA